ncbi:unnamed protein product [Paramecium pentaurelia]|uniref:RING-type domain-containing protein n=1 Tax=Paramecium pentaurelia TaxID=43138 RepID=A0A8S1WHA3_9CILI|nr:unnamed protein product [Paramecium pentaurelia]
MNISTSCAHSIRDFRWKNIILGCFSLLGLIFSCKSFVLDSNTFYQLIYISELIIGYFMMLVVFINQFLAMRQTQYVLTMSYLINETQRVNVQYTDQELEEMIKDECRNHASKCSVFYTSIKMCFHNFCCESKDFLYLVLSAGVIISYFFEQRFQQEDIGGKVFILFCVTFWDLLLVTLGFIIEMPRRIRQYYKMRALHRRATRLQFLDLQRQVQSLGDNNLEGQQGLYIDLLHHDLIVDQNNEQRQNGFQGQNAINAQDEQVQCQICFEDMNENTNVQQLQCHPSHIFHSDCITSWFQRKRQENLVPSCPICRAPQNR